MSSLLCDSSTQDQNWINPWKRMWSPLILLKVLDSKLYWARPCFWIRSTYYLLIYKLNNVLTSLLKILVFFWITSTYDGRVKLLFVTRFCLLNDGRLHFPPKIFTYFQCPPQIINFFDWYPNLRELYQCTILQSKSSFKMSKKWWFLFFFY